MKFNDAFRQARKEGKKVFDWKGRRYTTELAETTPGNTNAVKELQKFLQQKNLYTGNIDGIFGPKSEAALERFDGNLPYFKDLPSWIPVSNKMVKPNVPDEARVTQEDKAPKPKPAPAPKADANFEIPDTIVGGKSFGVSIGPPIRRERIEQPPAPQPTPVKDSIVVTKGSDGWVGLTDFEMGDLDGLKFDINGSSQNVRLSGPNAYGFDAVETRAFRKGDPNHYQQLTRWGMQAKTDAGIFLKEAGVVDADSFRVRYLDRETYGRPVYEMQYNTGDKWHNYDSAVVTHGRGVFSNYDQSGKYMDWLSPRQQDILKASMTPDPSDVFNSERTAYYNRFGSQTPYQFRRQLKTDESFSPMVSPDDTPLLKRGNYKWGGPMYPDGGPVGPVKHSQPWQPIDTNRWNLGQYVPATDPFYKAYNERDYKGASFEAGIDVPEVVHRAGSAEQQRAWLKSYIQSPRYKEILTQEFEKSGLDPAGVDQEIASRTRAVRSVPIDYKKVHPKGYNWVRGIYHPTGTDTMEVQGDDHSLPKYDKSPTPHHIYVDPDAKKLDHYVVMHELAHASTDGTKNLTPFAKSKLLESVNRPEQPGEENPHFPPRRRFETYNKEMNAYYDYSSDPTETHARLTELKYLLQQYGVYDPNKEKFTK